MTESSSSISTPAHIDIGQDTTFPVYLIQPLRGTVLVVAHWPEHAPEVEPHGFADVAIRSSARWPSRGHSSP